MDTNRIKTRILSLAFSGLLVDYSNKEKQNIILDRIHNEQKAYDPVLDDERLISAPSHWNWSRLAYLTYNHGQTIPISDFCYIDVGTLDNVHHRLAAKENHVTAKDAPSRARKIIEFEDVLYSTVRPYLHNICIVDKEFSKTPIASTAFCVMHARKEVLLHKFLFYWLLTPEFDKYSNGDPSKGALYPAIGEKDLLNGVIPVPSLEEQALIAEKIDTAFYTLDTIDTLQNQYQNNLASLKSKIIDASIQGKLTEQLPEEGTAEELYQQIQQEKQELIEAGKIKKEKPLPEITEDEIPFDIPESWKWCRIGSVFNLQAGKNVTSADIYEDSSPEHKYLCYGGNGVRGYVAAYNRDGFHAIIGRQGALCGNINFANGLFYATEHAVVVEQFANTDVMWCGYFLRALNLNQYATATAQPGLAVANINTVLIPLPPVSEQKRIVAKIEELLPLCNSLKG